MIARVWTARTTRIHAAAYAQYLQTHVIAALRGIDGYERALLLQKDAGDDVEVQVITFWRSLDAIRAFAGADTEAAVVTPEAAALLASYDDRVKHYWVEFEDS
jgi:heme-degrading monooxygenase HmoA